MEENERQEIANALDRLWAQFLPLMKERMGALEAAAVAFAANQLSEAQHHTASAAAHKLAGSLGSFGLTRGTVLARELEMMYSQESGPDLEMGAQLAKLTAQLRELIDHRK
jgi:HPt (histidine-containing phosphotransfer) domain-containing protein